MTSIYQEFEEAVRKKGEKVDMTIFGPFGEKSALIVDNLLITLEEGISFADYRRVVSVIDRGKGGLFIYLSPYAVRAGAKGIFGIDDPDISSEGRLEEILKRIREK